jgi:hypothetical protein
VICAVDDTPTAGDAERMRAFEAELAAVRADVGELLRSLRLVSQQVHWLVDNALITADAPICDLDADVDEAMVDLAATVERGEGFQSQLLDSVTRKELQLAVDRHADWERRLDDEHAVIVALSEAVAGDDDEPATLRAARKFATAAQALRDQEKEVPRLEVAAREATRRLRADDEVRREHATDIHVVADAWQRLYRQLRAVIDEGVAKHALFPAWFRNSLGLAPPPDQPTRWFELATEIRAYRVTYGVVAEDSPLGSPPAGDSTRRRQEWYRRLRAGLARLT